MVPDFRELFEAAPGLHLVLLPDPARTIVAVSNAYLRATMTRRAEILGRGLFEVFPDNPDDPQATGTRNLAASIERVLLGRAPDTMAVQKYDIRRPAEEGGGFEERWWSPCNSPVLGPDGEVRYIIHCVEDVTNYVRLQRADSELQARAQRMEMEVAQSEAVTALVRSAVDGIVTIDEHGIVHAFNPAAERMFGWAAHEVIGRNVSMLMPPPHRERHDRYVERYITEGKPRIIGIGRELEGVTRQGRLFPIHLAVSELSIGGRRMFAGFVRDMTERKQLEEQFLHSQKMEAVGALTSGIAHDFGNLLMGITGCANIALGKLDPEHPIARYLRELSEAAKRGTGLIRQLMSFSRKQAPTLVPLDLQAVIDGCAGLLRRLVGDDITIEIHGNAPRPAVVADAGQLEQVLVNLVVNARDAMPAGGRITISTQELVVNERGAEARGLPAAGRYVTLAVSDTGQGMDEGTRLRVFEPFFTTKDVGKGTGLGLATVYAIVQQLHGGVGVQSKLGRGTTFTLFLPVHEDAVADAEDRAPVPSAGRETVLVVDDDRLVRLSVRHYLEELGYRVVEALEPSDALRLGREQGSTFDLLLTDVIMPGIGGHSLARRLRELHPALGVLFMSAHASEELVARGSLAPGEEVLNKPFSQAQLAVAVRRGRRGRVHVLAARIEHPAQSASASILMVEDDSASRMVIGELLEELGHRVLAVTNATDALSIVERGTERIDVVLTDISLPDMLGGRLVERIRMVIPSVPVVYMSGYDSCDVALGPNDAFLTKPFDFDDLVGMVEDAIHRGRMASRAAHHQ